MKQFKYLALIFACAVCVGIQPVYASDLKLTETEDQIRVTLRGKTVLEYVKTAKPVPDGLDPHFQRSGYIHPIFTPAGQEITGDFPADHPHQHALFFAWTSAVFDGKKVDFWNQAKKQGNVEFREVVDLKREVRQVSFSVKHAFTVGMGDKWVDALHDTWTVTVHHTPDDHFLFDIESVQQCATDKPLTLPKYHYGGMAFRGNAQWLKVAGDHSIDSGNLVYLTSEGKDRWTGNHTQTNWVAFSGKLDGKDASAVVFCSPKNFRAPQSVRIHPDKPYFCFSPMVEGSFKIVPGERYVSRYRYLVTSKPMDVKTIKQHWDDYAKSEK